MSGPVPVCKWCCKPLFAHNWIVLFDQFVCGSAPMTDLLSVRRIYEYKERLTEYAKANIDKRKANTVED